MYDVKCTMYGKCTMYDKNVVNGFWYKRLLQSGYSNKGYSKKGYSNQVTPTKVTPIRLLQSGYCIYTVYIYTGVDCIYTGVDCIYIQCRLYIYSVDCIYIQV